jgi:hypothetical protein
MKHIFLFEEYIHSLNERGQQSHVYDPALEQEFTKALSPLISAYKMKDPKVLPLIFDDNGIALEVSIYTDDSESLKFFNEEEGRRVIDFLIENDSNWQSWGWKTKNLVNDNFSITKFNSTALIALAKRKNLSIDIESLNKKSMKAELQKHL